MVIFYGVLMIKIYRPIITIENERAKLSARVFIDGSVKFCHAIVDKEYAKYLCDERSDAFLIGLLHRAMRYNHDIVCEAPVSEELLYGIRNFLIPNLANNCERLHHINITADAAPAPSAAGAFGTGMSAGVDSFQCVFENMDARHPSHNITHLCFFNCGAFYGSESTFYEIMPDMKNISEQLKLPLVIVDSNIHKIIFGDFQITHTFYSLFCVYALRKLFGKYVYASGHPFADFDCKAQGVIGGDTASYDMMTFHCLSGPNLMLYSGGAGLCTRIEKTRAIMNNELVQKNLRVCMWDGVNNCGKCKKCRRTMLTLWLLGQLDKFSGKFPVDYFYDNLDEYLIHMVKVKDTNLVETEVYDLFSEKYGRPDKRKIRNLAKSEKK